MHNLLSFPQSAEQGPSLDSIKVRILGTLADVEADVPTCYLRKPVDIVEIYRFCYMDGSLSRWVDAAGLLVADGLAHTWLHLGKLRIELTGLGKERVMFPPELPDYPGDQGDETDGGMCAITFDENEQVSGERATSNMATAETDVSAEGLRHRALSEGMSVPSLPAHSTANGTESRYVDPELRAMTSLEVSPLRKRAAVLASKQMDELAAERICDHCKELIPVSSGSIYWRGMLFHLEQGRDCRMDFIVANTGKIDHRTGEFRS